jgi:hypothetical protein
MAPDHLYPEASIKTAADLRTVALDLSIHNLSRLTLPEVEAVVEQIAGLVPAGNIPGLILSGLARLSTRQLPQTTVKRDINMLFKGVKQTLNKVEFSAFFAGPAAIIWGYQSLLKLAGREADEAFPEGSWQFYVDYAMREDTARHANETHGFDTDLKRGQIHLSQVDRMTAWVMAAIDCLHQYHDLLANEWRERVHLALLVELTGQEPDAARYADLYRHWEKQRPYSLDRDELTGETYPAYRRRKFDQFLQKATAELRADLYDLWLEQIHRAEAEHLPAYQKQMSILAYLDPGPYGETRTPISLAQACVGLIYRGRYYLIPACSSGAVQAVDVQTVRSRIAALLAGASSLTPSAPPLAQIKRDTWPDLRHRLDQAFLNDLDGLRLAPILLNCDPRPRELSLSELRQTERGLGDHALTLFDTGETMVFDQSHIFFDGAWGAALAEIMTHLALARANQITLINPPQPDHQLPRPLTFNFQAARLEVIGQAPRVTPEVGVETEAIDVKAILKLRRLFKQRSDLIQLTVNDLLLLYRAIHAVTYQPDPELVSELQRLAHHDVTRPAALAALEAIDRAEQDNPAIVMPVDASQRSPRDRLYPITFEVPLSELDLLELRERTMAALTAYNQARGDRTSAYAEFDRLQRDYLARLAGFGELMNKAKEIARTGQSFSFSTIKLLAHIPAPLQRMLEKIPESFDLLNDMIKGREVFSNVGAVAPTSTLTRFISAKDDNDKKTLIWGVLTDAGGVMRITLRDFRPHVSLLVICGHKQLATRLAQHYLDAYARGLNSFIRDLQQMTQASRETRPRRLESSHDRGQAG